MKHVNGSHSHELAGRAQLVAQALERLHRRAYRVTITGKPSAIGVHDDTASAGGDPALVLDPRDAFDLGMALVNAAYRWEVGK